MFFLLSSMLFVRFRHFCTSPKLPRDSTEINYLEPLLSACKLRKIFKLQYYKSIFRVLKYQFEELTGITRGDFCDKPRADIKQSC